MPLLASLTNPHMTLDQLRVCLEYMVLSLGMEDLTYVPCFVPLESRAPVD